MKQILMHMPVSIFIGLRYLWNPHLSKFKKFITIISILGIGFSTAFLIIIMSIMNGFEEYFQKNILSFIPHIIVTNEQQYINQIEFPDVLLKWNNVQKISHFISKLVIVKHKKNITSAEILGIDSNNYENISNYQTNKSFCLLLPKKYYAIIGSKLFQTLNLKIGDKINLILLSNEANVFSGKIFNQHEFKIIGTFSTNHEIDYHQILINKEDSLKFLHYKKNYITGWRVWLKDPLFFNMKKIKQDMHNFVFLTWKMKKGEVFQAIQLEKYMMLLFLSIIFLLCFFNIFVNITVNIIEKENSIALLKAQGLLDWKIILIFVILSCSISVLGNVLGILISIILMTNKTMLKYLIHLFFENIEIPIILMPYQIILINIIITSIVICSTLYPSWRIIKLKPYKILRHE